MSDHDYQLDAWRALLLAHSTAVRAIEQDVGKSGQVPLTWYDVLLELNAAGRGGLRMQEVARRVVLSRTRVSRLVDEMVRAALVEKQADPHDKRVYWASITDQGRRALRDTAPVYLRSIRDHFSAYLSDDEARVIAEGLGKVAQTPPLCAGSCVDATQVSDTPPEAADTSKP